MKPLPRFTISVVIVMLLPVSTKADPTATGDNGNIVLLHDNPGNGGGGTLSGNGGAITAEVTTGDGTAGGVSTGAIVRETGGFTGNLYDPTSLTVSATPSTAVNEGDGVQLSALITMDDASTLDTATGIDWSVQNGPATVSATGLAIAQAVNANEMATIRGTAGSIFGDLNLTIINLPFESNTVSWNDPGDGGPFTVFFGTTANPPQVATPSPNLPFFNPGQLEMGQQYFFQVLDQNDNDITPGGPGVQSFTTSLFQPDMRIGNRGNPETHKRDNLYNTSGGGQVAKIKMIGKRKGKLFFSLENDGDSTDDTKIRGTKANRKFKFIKYFRLTGGRANVTAALIRAGYTQADMDPDDVTLFQIQAKANGKRRAGQTLKIGATSAGDARGTDLAKGKLKGLVKK